MRKDRDEYNDIYKLDMTDEWMNAAYDESGEAVACDICGADIKWDRTQREWYCPECGQTMTRALYFNHIGAEPPGLECLTTCCENYPFCKKYCERYFIDPDDPMLT